MAAQAYALQVLPIPTRLFDFSDEALEARIFVRTAREHRPGPEDLMDRLNDPDTRFIAADTDDGMQLLHLGWISHIERSGRAPEVDKHEEEGCCRPEVEIDMIGGATLKGRMLYVLPAGSRRVSDLLNASGQRFLLLYDGETTRFVNREAVLRVRT
jgi:hypothetical protein